MSEQDWSAVPPFMAQATLIEQIAVGVRRIQRFSSARIGQQGELLRSWDIFGIKVQAITDTLEADFYAVLDGMRRSIEYSREMWSLFDDLRRVMYVEGGGTWFTAEVEVPREGSAAARFNYDDEPRWNIQPGATQYLWDFERFPRNEKHTPEWLAEGRALESGRFGPEVWFGVRFQASFTPWGQEVKYDPRPGPQTQQWAGQVVERLTAAGVAARVDKDTDETFLMDEGMVTEQDIATQADWQVWFPTVLVPVGRDLKGHEGYCQVPFWSNQVGWSVDVWEQQADRATAQRILTAVHETVTGVTGWPVVESQVNDGYTHVMVGLGPVA